MQLELNWTVHAQESSQVPELGARVSCFELEGLIESYACACNVLPWIYRRSWNQTFLRLVESQSGVAIGSAQPAPPCRSKFSVPATTGQGRPEQQPQAVRLCSCAGHKRRRLTPH